MLPLMLIAAAGADVGRLAPYRVGVTSAKPHDPERLRKAQEKRARKAARKL
jgi:hypothetical protein